MNTLNKTCQLYKIKALKTISGKRAERLGLSIGFLGGGRINIGPIGLMFILVRTNEEKSQEIPGSSIGSFNGDELNGHIFTWKLDRSGLG